MQIPLQVSLQSDMNSRTQEGESESSTQASQLFIPEQWLSNLFSQLDENGQFNP